MVQTLSVADVQPGNATGTSELAEQQPPPPSAGTGPGAGDRGEVAAGACGAQPTGAREPGCTRRPGTDQTPRLAQTIAVVGSAVRLYRIRGIRIVYKILNNK